MCREQEQFGFALPPDIRHSLDTLVAYFHRHDCHKCWTPSMRQTIDHLVRPVFAVIKRSICIPMFFSPIHYFFISFPFFIL